jgi:hypothetical protein
MPNNKFQLEATAPTDPRTDILKHMERGRGDIVYFAWYFLGIKLHPGQIRFLRGADGQINVLVPGNRFGKTILVAVRHIWHNFYKIGVNRGPGWSKAKYRTAALAPDSNILEIDFNTIKALLTSSFVISREGEPIQTNNCRIGWFIKIDQCRNTAPYFIQLTDNCSIKFYSTGESKGGNVQGDKFGYGSYDEGGRSYHLELEIQQNLGPRFSELDAPLDIVSTPAMDSPSILFHKKIFDKGLKGEGGYRSFEGSAYENLYLPKHYFEREETRLKGHPLRDQVLDGKFVFGGDNIFHPNDILAAEDEALNGGIPGEPGRSYKIGIDTAIGSDEMVYTVLDDTELPMRCVRMLAAKGNSKSPDIHIADFVGLFNQYNFGNVRIVLESFNGDAAHFYTSLPQEIQRVTKCFGTWQPPGYTPKMSGRNLKSVRKAEWIIALSKALANHEVKIPVDSELSQQLSVYREEDANLQTDRVVSLALAIWLATDGKPKTTKLEYVEVDW